MNSTIETLLNHRSIRKFKEEALTDEQIHTLVRSAQAASTSSFIQAYSIIGVKDIEKKKKLAEVAGNQQYVAENGHLFIFCGDVKRHAIIADMYQESFRDTLENTETFMVAVIDATLAAQNAVIVAESMGLGVCYIGGLRNNLKAVNDILHIPEQVMPLFGLVVGYPDQNPDPKPRLPLENVYHEEGYQTDTALFKAQLTDYDEMISSYYHERTNGKRSDKWTEQMVQTLKTPRRAYMKQYVEGQRFTLK